MFKPVAVVPVYNHAGPVGGVVAGLRAQGLPVILVDDGSDAACAAVLDQLAMQTDVTLQRHMQNQGKGAAMCTGFKAAAAAGFSHVLQIDADGQHAQNDVPLFITRAQMSPEAIINGCPIYDESVPKARLYGRYATHIWVWINTLSFRIVDSMCGFRVYPLEAVLPLIHSAHIGRRMDFDTEILVRLDWAGVTIRNQPTRVRYPEDGISHFAVWRDNLMISAMHTRLFLGMLCRLPRLIARLTRGQGRPL
jgi:glycosyltransferase involved in cell wall biosynthesis